MASPWRDLRDGVQYSFRIRDNEARSCKVVCASISGIAYEDNLEFPCFHCCVTSFNNDYSKYSRHCELEFAKSLFSCNGYGFLPHDCVRIVARDFADHILRPANDNHRCPPLYFNPGYILEIRFRFADDDDDLHRVLIDSFEEDSGPTTKPASISYVSELIKLRDEKVKNDSVWSCTDNHRCSICIDEIDMPSNSLSLDCSHVFHHKCILRWLAENNVCPLCRFQMPTET